MFILYLSNIYDAEQYIVHTMNTVAQLLVQQCHYSFVQLITLSQLLRFLHVYMLHNVTTTTVNFYTSEKLTQSCTVSRVKFQESV